MKYVSVYQRSGRSVWYVSYPDTYTGKRICRATVHRTSDPLGRKKAYDEAIQQAKQAAVVVGVGQAMSWGNWVPRWLELGFKPRSKQRYATAWRHLEEYLRMKQLPVPRAVNYATAEDYLSWRTSQQRPRGTYINYNTALTELRFFGSVMREAVRRGFCEGNPIGQLGLSRRNVKEKPEITEAEDLRIRSELRSRPAWMLECYQVAICQGCRLMETMVPMSQVDLARNTITFHGKGGKVFTTAMHPGVRPLAEAKQKVGSRHLVDLPPMPAKAWWKFFGEVGLSHLCFHCTKVTVITRLCRAGVPQGVAMSYVNHSSEEVHRIYQRLKVADVAQAVAALPVASGTWDAPAPTPQSAPLSYRSRRRQKVSPASA